MAIQPRLVVAGHDADGRSVVVTDQPAPQVTVRAYPGSEFFPLWGTPDGGVTVGGPSGSPTLSPFFAGPGGTRMLFARYAPEATTPEPVGDPAELDAEVDATFPGLRDVFEPGDTSGLHATDTLDYGVCLEGELTMVLDDGSEVVLTPGTAVVQPGTRHAWHNRGTTPALMCFVGIGAIRAT